MFFDFQSDDSDCRFDGSKTIILCQQKHVILSDNQFFQEGL